MNHDLTHAHRWLHCFLHPARRDPINAASCNKGELLLSSLDETGWLLKEHPDDLHFLDLMSLMDKILIIDDDIKLVKNIETYLKDFGYQTEAALNGIEGLQRVKSFQPDLVILDLMMPEMDGLEVCKEIRKDNPVPVLMLTARGKESDVIVGLEVGADDYLTKPFSLRELVARIKAALRRTKAVQTASASKEKILVCGDLVIDPARREVVKKKKKITLTSTEFNLLWLLASNPGIVFSRDRLLDELRERELEPFDRSIDAHISHLRKKIEDSPKDPKYILTVWSTGYKFREM
jgi:DNA-binding response OmpR family regulator